MTHRRQEIADLLLVWWDKHGGRPVTVRDLDPNITLGFGPANRGRQSVAAGLEKLVGTRLAG